MTLSDIFLGLNIAWTDGPAIRAMVDEINTNPVMIAGIKAIEHALNAYHSGSSAAAIPDVKPIPQIDLHAVIIELQNHVGPQPEGPGPGANV